MKLQRLYVIEERGAVGGEWVATGQATPDYSAARDLLSSRRAYAQESWRWSSRRACALIRLAVYDYVRRAR